MDEIYRAVRGAHSYIRWVALLATAGTFWTMLRGFLAKRAMDKRDRSAAFACTIVLDVQLLLGLALLAVSPAIRVALLDLDVAMQESRVRFLSAEHPITMLAAVAFAHAGSATVRRSDPEAPLRLGRATALFAVALALIVVAIPWFRLGGR